MQRKISGFTLIEMMVTLTVAAILLTLAIPSFTSMIDRNRLKSAAESLYADLQFARAEAIKRNKPLRVSFYANGATWCYGLKESADCNCQQTESTQADFCEIENVPTTVSSAEFKNISVTNAWINNTFTPLRGTVKPGHIEFQSSNNKKLQVRVSKFGRVRLCSPAGEENVSGYPVCS